MQGFLRRKSLHFSGLRQHDIDITGFVHKFYPQCRKTREYAQILAVIHTVIHSSLGLSTL